jgi:hypothetical protein
MEESAMHEQTAVMSGELDSLDMDAEHVMPPEHADAGLGA